MVPSPVLVGLRSASHFAGGNDQRLVEQAALIQIRDQRCVGLIERWQEMLLDIITVAMRIPTVAIHTVVVHRYEADTGLDEPPGHQARLAKQMAAVAVPDLGRLAANVQCRASTG